MDTRRSCDMHGALEVEWDAYDIPDKDGEPQCWVCELENKEIVARQRIKALEKSVEKIENHNTVLRTSLTAANIKCDELQKNLNHKECERLRDVAELKMKIIGLEQEIEELNDRWRDV